MLVTVARRRPGFASQQRAAAWERVAPAVVVLALVQAQVQAQVSVLVLHDGLKRVGFKL